MSTANRVLKNTLFLYGKIAITSVCLILSTRYVLEALGVDDFGIYNLICSTVVMLGFLNDSMTAATQRFMSFTEGQGKKERSIVIFNSSYVVHIGLALLIALIFICIEPLVFGKYLQIPPDRIGAAKIIYFFTIFATLLNVMTVPYNAVLIAHENLLYFSILGAVDGIFKLASAIGLLYVDSDRLIVYSLFITGIGILNFLIIRIYCHHKYTECKINLKKHVEVPVIKDMFSFAGWQLTYSASSILSIQGLSLILNSFFGPVMNASQAIARQICGQLMTLSGTLMSALNPVIVKSAGKGDRQNMVAIVMTGSKVSYLLVIIVALPILFELPFILEKWLKEIPEYTIPFCRYEVLQQIIASFTITLVTMISGVGDIKHFQLFSSLTYILRLPIVYILFLVLNMPIAAYWVTTLAVFILCVGRVYYAKIKCGLPVAEYVKQVIVPCILVTLLISVSLVVVNETMNPSWLRLFVSLITTIVVLLPSSYLFVINKTERGMLISGMKSFLNRIKPSYATR